MKIAVENCKSFYFRETRMGGLTRTVLVSSKDFEVIRPTRTRRSKSGTHGEDIYCVEDWSSVAILRFERSNRGRTYLYCDNVSKDVCDELRKIFEVTDSVEETIKYLQSKLSPKIEV